MRSAQYQMIVIRKSTSIVLNRVLIFLTAITLSGCSPSQVNSAHTKAGVIPTVSQATPLSDKTDVSKAVIPFFVMNHHIFITALIDKIAFPCVVDTGTEDIVWPKTLQNLKSKPCPDFQQEVTFTGPNQSESQAECRKIDDVHFGNYGLVSPDTLRLSQFHPSIGSRYIVVGNAAFDQSVLTIDMQRQELVVHDHQFNVTKLALHQGDQIVPFTREDDTPIFNVQVNHHPARFLLDTGASVFAIKKAFCQRYHLPQQISDEYITSSFAEPTLAYYVEHTPVTLARVPLGTPRMAVMNELSSNVDGSLGMPLLKKYRITIDYPRRRMLLEPYVNSR